MEIFNTQTYFRENLFLELGQDLNELGIVELTSNNDGQITRTVHLLVIVDDLLVRAAGAEIVQDAASLVSIAALDVRIHGSMHRPLYDILVFHFDRLHLRVDHTRVFAFLIHVIDLKFNTI